MHNKQKMPVPFRDFAQKLDYLQKSGGVLSRREAETLEVEDAYYLVLMREAIKHGYEGYYETSFS